VNISVCEVNWDWLTGLRVCKGRW